MEKFFQIHKLSLGLLLILFFLAPPLWGEEVEQISQSVQKAYEQTSDLSFDFLQNTYVVVLERDVKKRGESKFKKPGKFFIQYSGANGRNYISNGKKLWVFQKGDRQVQVYPISDERVPPEAMSFLGGLGNLEKEFAVEAVETKRWKELKAKPGSLKWLELTPLKKRSQIRWLVMGFDPNDFLAREVYLLTENGNLTHYKFSALQTNQDLPETYFEFKQKGVKEISM